MGKAAKRKKSEAKKNEPKTSSQHTGKDLQIFYFDVLGGVRLYKIMMRLRKKRQIKLAPVILGENNVPVTPCSNPSSGASHHILRLTNSQVPGYMVDLLIKDTNLYITAFRRHRMLTEEELMLSEEERKALNNNSGAGIWYMFGDDITLGLIPKIIKNYRSMGIGSSHGDVTSIGGDIAFNEMFYSLAQFEDGTTNENALKRAIANAIIAFCEASRFKSIYNLMISRMGNWTTPGSDLAEETWKRIHGWQVLGGYWLQCRLAGVIDADEILSHNFDVYKFDPMTMGSLMDELLVVKFEQEHLIDIDKLNGLQTK